MATRSLISQSGTLELLAQLNIRTSSDSAAALAYAREHYKAFRSEQIDVEDVIAAFKSATRVFFSQADAMVFLMRRAIVENINDPSLYVNPRDRSWFLNSPDKARFLHAAKLVTTYFPRLWGAELHYPKGSEGYRAFRRLAVCRGRFTHPNIPEHLLPVELLPLLGPGAQWFLFSYSKCVVQQARAAGFSVKDPTDGRQLAQARDATFDRAERMTAELIEARFPVEEAARIEVFLSQLMRDSFQALELVPSTVAKVGWAQARWTLVSLLEALVTEIEGAAHICGSSLAVRGLLPEGGTRDLLQGDVISYCNGIADIADRFAASLGRGQTLPRTGAGWQSFLRLKKLRDRVAHPRSLVDVEIDPLDLGDILAAAEWTRELLLPQFSPMPERMSKES